MQMVIVLGVLFHIFLIALLLIKTRASFSIRVTLSVFLYFTIFYATIGLILAGHEEWVDPWLNYKLGKAGVSP
jgi:hypothetical protein